MKKIIIYILVIFISSCGETFKKNVFIGEWVLSESSPYYSVMKTKDFILKITKDDIFYKVDVIQDGKSGFDEGIGSLKTEQEKKEMESIFKYQLSPDKRTLINVVSPSLMISYNDDNKTITTAWGWFKRK